MDVITIGDALIAMNPLTNGPLRFTNNFERKVGGAELNVAIGCSRLGLKTGWISKLGKDEFGRFITNYVRGEGIDTTHLYLVKNFPTSIYFKEVFDEERINSYYYRHKSPTNTFTLKDINEDYIKQAKILHISGVFPAINETNKDIVMHILKIAQKHNVFVTFDPNIRLKLWTAEEAKETLSLFLPYVDALITGEEEAEILLGTSNLEEIINYCMKKYNISHVVLKQGENGATAYKNEEIIYSPAFNSSTVIDTIGAGDAFAAGYIYSLIKKWPLKKALQFANAVASYAIGVPGDNEGLPYKEDIDDFLGKTKKVVR